MLISATLLAATFWLSLPHRPPPRLVVLYAPCTVNRSFLSPYNSKVSYTPYLDAFARAGTVFKKHHTEEGQSGIAYASLFSGNQAMRHGVFVHPAKLNDSAYLISEAYREGGYDVLFWADQIMANPGLNYAQGIDPSAIYYARLTADAKGFVEMLARMRSDPTYKALVVTNFTVTHNPYRRDHLEKFCARYPQECPAVTKENFARYLELFGKLDWRWQYDFDAMVNEKHIQPDELAMLISVTESVYKSNIAYLDQLFGDLIAAIDAAGLSQDSLIAFTADHGEALYRKRLPLKWAHGFMLSFDDIVVPLILRGPGVPVGAYEGVTRSIDVFPTLATLSGMASPSDIMGVDLAAAIAGSIPPPPLIAYSHTSLLPRLLSWTKFPPLKGPFPRNDPSEIWAAARDVDHMYKLTSHDGIQFVPHVYDWETDSEEARDLYDSGNEKHQDMVRRLAQYKSALREGYSHWRAVTEGRIPTEREDEILRSLGYIQ